MVLYSIGLYFHSQTYPQLGVITALAQPLHSFWTPTDLGGSSFSAIFFVFSHCSWGSQGKNTDVLCHSLLQWTMFCQTLPIRNMSFMPFSCCMWPEVIPGALVVPLGCVNLHQSLGVDPRAAWGFGRGPGGVFGADQCWRMLRSRGFLACLLLLAVLN